MDLETFEATVQHEWEAIPEAHKEGIVALVVEAAAHYDPNLAEVPLLGECVFDELMDTVEAPVHSTIHLYYGSFVIVASEEPGFDWQGEVRETLHHELTHHLEWRAGHDTLGEHEDVELENLNRRAGLPFEPSFYRFGREVARRVFLVGEEAFIEVSVPPAHWHQLFEQRAEVRWGGWCFVCAPPLETQSELLFVDIEDGWDEAEGADGRVDEWVAVTVVFRRRRIWFRRKADPAVRILPSSPLS